VIKFREENVTFYDKMSISVLKTYTVKPA